MSKKKITVLIVSVAVLIAAALIAFNLFYVKNGSLPDDFEKIRFGMKPWENMSVPGISVYVPDDYTQTENEFFTSYVKDGATVSLTSEAVENDLANYAYYAVRKYENITDSFVIREEYDEEVNNCPVHVVEFDYSLLLDSGSRYFSCLSAYMLGNGRSYILSCVSDTDEYQLFRDDFHRIYKTMAVSEVSKEN